MVRSINAMGHPVRFQYLASLACSQNRSLGFVSLRLLLLLFIAADYGKVVRNH